MTAAFIRLTFEWLWLIITGLFVGGPLLVILMSWRAFCDANRGRSWAIASLISGTALAAAIWVYFDTDDGPTDHLEVLVFAALTALSITWLGSISTTRRGWIWADLLVIAIPAGLGLWMWHIE